MPPSVAARLEQIAASNPPSLAAIDRRTGKPRRISKPVRNAIRLMLSGECKEVKAAAARVSLSREHLSKMLAMPHVQAFIAQENAKTIGIGSLRAAARAVELVDADSEHVAADMSRWILGVQGIRPKEESVGGVMNQVNIGYVINLSSDAGPQIDHLGNNEAKPLIDQVAVRREE